MPLSPTCNLPPPEPGADRCSLVAGHDGPCRAVSWAELQAMFDEANEGPVLDGPRR